MTNNILIQFSCSAYKTGDTIPEGKNVGDLKDYPVVSGSIFNEEYNETLDSATVLLSQVKKEDRLSNLKPYDYVRVYDASTFDSTTGKYSFDKLFLVDNFDEQENNIKEHIFGYTINLMSETKWLEKIQCPNLVISHQINEDGSTTKKTIYHYIKQYMELFVPKIKFSSGDGTWKYEYLIKIHDETTSVSVGSSNFVSPDDFISYQGGYIVSVESNVIPNTYDLDLISNERVTFYQITGTPVVFDGTQVKLDRINRKIIFTGYVSSFPSSYIGVTNVSFLFDYHENELLSKFGKIGCADLTFNTPTLRQLLTTLMQQLGCIPVVKNRELSFLDFQKEAVPFANEDYSLNDTVNYIKRGLSSDSYVNTLVNISSQVLDSGNEVISETLCFRDSSNVLLKQQENLFLETSFPIYKINKCLLHAPGKLEGYISSGYGCFHSLSTTSWSATEYNFPMCYYKLSLISENQMEEKQISWTISIPTDSADSGYTVQNCVIHLLGKNSTGAFYEIEAIKDDDFIVSQSNTTLETVQFDPPDGEISGQLYIDMRNYTRRYEDIDSEVVAFWISGTFIDNENDSNTKDFVFFKFTTEDEDETYPSYVECYPPVGITSPIPASGLINGSAVVKYKLNNFILPRTWDITKLIVENSARQLLSRDFNAMGQEINLNDPGDITINKLSKYVYGTVGYSIGSKKISGFSEVYSAGHGTVFGWIQENYTYIENITTALSYDQTQLYDISHTIFADMPVILITGPFSNNSLGQGTFRFDGFEYYNPNSTLFSTNHPFFSLFFVDLYYQPMNSFNISYVKSQEDIDIPIQQYDSNVSGVTDFDRLSINEQEQVDRIGNEVLTINQRTDYYDDIQNFENGPLYFLDDTNRDGYINGTDNSIKYIIFKRSFTINNNHFNVSYVGSKDAILKNYFTSIRTKYRAYQYLDYGQSTLRKEKDVVFMRIASNRYNGDNRIWLGNYSTKKASNLSYFIYDLSNTSTTKISYECEQALTNPVDDLMPETADKQSIKNSVSLITTKNTLGIIYEYMDYIGAGTYLPQITTVSQFSYETSDDERLGGIPQKWQIWGNDYNISHTVSFVLDIDFYGQLTQDNPSGGAGNFIENTTLKIQKNPIVASTDLNFSFIDLENDDKNIFSVCDDNSLSAGNYLNVQRSFGKDYFELINHTVQFIYYAPNNDVLFGEDFISGCPLISRFEHPFNVICSSSTFDLNLIPHVMNENDKLATKEDDGDNFYEDYIAQNNYSMTVYWGNNNIIKLCHKNKEGQIIDLLAFKRLDLTSSSTTFYFSLNDTKTDYVMGLTNEGVLYRKYKVKTYTNEVSMPREVDDID